MQVEIVGNNLVITIPMQKPTPSASGKTMVVATTRGNVKTTAQVEGHAVTVGVNAYFSR